MFKIFFISIFLLFAQGAFSSEGDQEVKRIVNILNIEFQSLPLFSIVWALILFTLCLIAFWIYDARKKKQVKFLTHEGREVQIVALLEKSDREYLYQVKISGELWNAKSKKEFSVGARAIVKEHQHENNILVIE